MANVMGLLFTSIKDLVLVAYKLDSLLVFILLDGLCEGSVQDLASVGRDAWVVKAVENLGRGDGFIVRGTAAVFGADGVFIGGGEHVLLAGDLCFAGDVDGAEETALLGMTEGLTVSRWSVSVSSRNVLQEGTVQGGLRLRSLHGDGVIAMALREGGAHAPFGLLVCIALVILSSAAKVGFRVCLLRRHG